MKSALITIQPYGTEDWIALGNGDIYDVLIEEQLITRTKGYDTLQFKMPLDNVKQKYVKNERIVRINSDRQYRIRTIEKNKASSRVLTVYCESLWYDLNNGALTNHIGTTSQTIEQAVNQILNGTGWSFGESDITETHSYTINDPVTPLYKLRYVQRIFNAEMTFDTVNMTVNLYQQAGEDTNIVISYDSNVDSIVRNDDTTKLTTRVYMYGKDDLTIAPINGGIEYLENYTWMDSEQIPRAIKAHTIKDDRFTDMNSMLEYMQNYLDRYSSPLISYELGQTIIEKELNIGDTLRVQDIQLGQNDEHRIAEKRINVIFPEQSVYVLDWALDDLSSEDEDFEESGTANRIQTQAISTKDNDLLVMMQEMEERIKKLEGD